SSSGPVRGPRQRRRWIRWRRQGLWGQVCNLSIPGQVTNLSPQQAAGEGRKNPGTLTIILVSREAAAAGRGTAVAFGRCLSRETTVGLVAKDRACHFSPRINCYRGPTWV